MTKTALKLSESTLRRAIEKTDADRLLAAMDGQAWSPEALDTLVGMVRRLPAIRMDPTSVAARAAFLDQVVSAIVAQGRSDAAHAVASAAAQLALAEEGYARVSAALELTDYARLAPVDRVAAILARSVGHREGIAAEVEANIVRDGLATPQATVLRDYAGRPLAVDAALHHYVAAASTVLGLEGRRQGWMRDGALVLPVVPDSLTRDQIDAAADGEYLAQAWGAWRRFEERGRFLSGVLAAEDPQVWPGSRRFSFTRILTLAAGEDDWDLFAAQSRWNELVALTASDLRADASTARRLGQLAERPALPPLQFVSRAEALGYFEIWIQLGYPPETETVSIAGLSLLQWLRGFTVLGVLAEAAHDRGETSDLGLILITEAELLNALALGRLGVAAASAFVSAASFGPKVRDLYDGPLIRLEDGRFLLFGPGVLATNPGGVIRSIWEQHRIEFQDKGQAFEARVLDRLRGLGLKAVAFETRRDDEDFQYDVILEWGEQIFVFECKNRALPGDEPIQGRWFLNEVDKGVDQVNRLAAALPQFAKLLHERFEIDLAGKTIVPCLLNNLPFARPGRTRGCFVYDYAALDRFFSARHLNVKVYQEIEGRVIEQVIPVIPMWADSAPTAVDLLAELEDPLVLRIMRHHARRETTEIALDNTVMVLSPEYALEPTTPESFAKVGGANVGQVKLRLQRAKKRLKKLTIRAHARRPRA
jgi:hypothetical protein